MFKFKRPVFKVELNQRAIATKSWNNSGNWGSTNRLTLILVLDLNSPQAVQWRLMWLRITEMARQNDSSLYTMLVGFPQNLPNLQSIPVLTPSPNISVADLDGDLIRITAYRTILPILLAFTLGGIDRNDDFLATGIANVTGFVVHCLIVLCQMFFRSTS